MESQANECSSLSLLRNGMKGTNKKGRVRSDVALLHAVTGGGGRSECLDMTKSEDKGFVTHTGKTVCSHYHPASDITVTGTH